MEIGPDGSLCRITSSVKDIVNNIKIVKVSEDELQNCDEPHYKLVFIGETENDSESLSEMSDEETLEEEFFRQSNIKLSTENIEKERDVKVQEAGDESKPQRGMFTKKTFNKRFNQKNMQQNHKNYKFPDTKNSNSTGNKTKTYNRSSANTSRNNIEPWLNPPTTVLNTYPYAIYPQFSPVVEPVLSNHIQPDMPVGLLGDSPFDPFPQHNFQLYNQNNRFGHNQNFWNGNYSSSYQTSTQINPPVHENYYPKKYRRNKGKSNFRKGNKNKGQQGRRNDEGYFQHRN